MTINIKINFIADIISLSSLALSYDIRFNIMICLKCHTLLPPKKIAFHIRSFHTMTTYSNLDIRNFLSNYKLEDVNSLILPCSVVSPIPALPIVDGYMCSYSSCGKTTEHGRIKLLTSSSL